MKAVVVYESLWGSTAAAARAIAEGIGGGTPALSTAEATPAAIAEADLIVVGSPVLGFGAPSDKMLEGIRANPGNGPKPPDLSQPPMATWLASVPPGAGRGATAFETRVRGPFGHATKAIMQALEGAGYRPLGHPKGFIVKGRYGPLRDGELEKATEWGVELARSTVRVTPGR